MALRNGTRNRATFGVVTLAGIVLLIDGGIAPFVVFLALLVASAGWVFITRTRAVAARPAEPRP